MPDCPEDGGAPADMDAICAFAWIAKHMVRSAAPILNDFIAAQFLSPPGLKIILRAGLTVPNFNIDAAEHGFGSGRPTGPLTHHRPLCIFNYLVS